MRTCKAKSCKKRFEPKGSTLQPVCSPPCAIEYTKQLRVKNEANLLKEIGREHKKIKQSIKTNQDYVKELQPIFNTFIRLRDQKETCICCHRPLEGKFDAGHYFPAGSYPMIRFDEDNTHGQTVHCNRDKHGNLAEYTINLPKRIGKERFEALKERRLIPRKYSIPELIELKVIYKDKVKRL